MKNLSITIFFFCFIISAQAQTNSAAFIAFKGEGSYQRGRKQVKLDFPMLFNSGDRIKLVNGSAILLLANGSEIELYSGIEYIVPKIKRTEMIVELDASVFQDFVSQSQSNSSISLRGDSLFLSLYPISSKVNNIENSKIVWNFDNKESSFNFKIYDSNTLDLIFSKEKFKANEIELKDIKLKAGNEYTWNLKISNSKVEQLGIISVLDKKELLNFPKLDVSNKLNIMKAYQYYIENEFYFESYNLMKMAKQKYPKIDLFSYLFEKMNGK